MKKKIQKWGLLLAVSLVFVSKTYADSTYCSWCDDAYRMCERFCLDSYDNGSDEQSVCLNQCDVQYYTCVNYCPL